MAKQSIRQAESALLEAEALSCMAGLDQRRELRQAWRALLFRQNHDTAAGTAMADVYTRLAADSAAWSRTVARLRDASLARLPLPPDADLVVANPTPWQREEWIRADDAVLRSHRAPTVAVSAGGERFALQRTGTGTGFLAPVGPWEVSGFRLEEGEQPPRRRTRSWSAAATAPPRSSSARRTARSSSRCATGSSPCWSGETPAPSSR